MFKTLNRSLFILSLIGLGISGYLAYTYISQSPILCLNAGCESVRNSPYANLFGIPMPLYGLIGYGFLAVLTFIKTTTYQNQTLINRLILVATTFGFLFSLYLTGVEAFVIKQYCMWCIASAVVMTLMFLLSLTLRKENGTKKEVSEQV